MTLPPSFATTLWSGAVVALAVSILFAPVITYGWCADAIEGGASTCGSSQHSVVGIPSSIWLWAGSLAVVLIVTSMLAIRARRH
jgi:hypothetical protein